MKKNKISKIKVFDEEIVAKEQFYLNNPGLPTRNSEYEWTPEMIDALERSKDDISYFAENFFTIINKSNREVIKLYDKQKSILNTFMDNNRVILLTSRQFSKTTLLSIYVLWLANFYPDQNILILGQQRSTASELIERISLAYLELPSWLKTPIDTEFNKSSFKLINGSKVQISATTENAVRGKSISCLIIDELAHIDRNIENAFWGAITPTIISNPKAKLFIASTPKGVDNLFYKLVQRADNKKSIYVVERAMWYDIPGRGKEWKKNVIESELNGDEEMFEQEYECKFLGSSRSPFGVRVFQHIESCIKEPLEIFDDGAFRIWEFPENNKIYSIGVDVSEGIGKDSSVIQVFDMTDLTKITQCACWSSNKIDIISFKNKILEICLMYGNPVLSVERNNCGADICNRLYTDDHYPRFVNHGVKHQSDKSFRSGVLATAITKLPAVTNLKYWLVDTLSVIIRDNRFLEEFRNFEKKGRYSWEAASGFHDDLVMSTVWAINVLHRDLINKYYAVQEYSLKGMPVKIKNKFDYSIKESRDLITSKYSDYSNIPICVFGRQSYTITPKDNDSMANLLSHGWEEVKF